MSNNIVVINYDDGTVTDLRGSVVVNLDKLDDAGEHLWCEWLEGGDDATACEIGRTYGVEITDLIINYSNKEQ